MKHKNNILTDQGFKFLHIDMYNYKELRLSQGKPITNPGFKQTIREMGDFLFKLRRQMRNELNRSYNQGLLGKTTKFCTETIGLTGPEFVEHLRSLGGEPSNFGKEDGNWNIDHIVPTTHHKSIESIVKGNHYTNLQPMDKIENIKKGNRYVG